MSEDKFQEFVPYELSLDLKELGFDEPCFAYYNGYEELDHLMPERVIVGRNYNGDTITSAPLYQQAFRWFREKYYLHSYIKCSCSVNEIFSFDWIIHKIMNAGTKEENFLTDYERTYEEAEFECLKKLIEIVKSEKNKSIT